MHKLLKALLAVAYAVLAGQACAAEPLKLVTGEYAPYTGASLPNSGPLSDMVRRVLSESGYEVSVAFLPWKRGYADALKGEYAGTFPYVRNAEREKDFLFSDPFYTVTRRLYYLAKSNINPTALATLKGKQLCVPLGFAVAQELSDMVDAKELATQSPPGLTQCVEMLAKGRVDAFTATAEAGAEAIASAQVSEEVLSNPIGKTEFHFLAAKASPGGASIIAAFNRGLAVLKKKK